MGEIGYCIESFPSPTTGIFINKKHIKAIVEALYKEYSFDYDSVWDFKYDENLTVQENLKQIIEEITQLTEERSSLLNSQNWSINFTQEGHVLAVTLGLTRYTYVNPDAFLQAIHPYVEPDAYMMKNEKTSEDYPRLKITFEDKSSKFPQVENSLEIYGIVDAVNYLLEHFSGTTTLNQILTTVKLKNSIKN